MTERGQRTRGGPCGWDLRALRVCSVDPPGCRDIDDALSCRDLPCGALELGVHIADVSSFLLPVGTCSPSLWALPALPAPRWRLITIHVSDSVYVVLIARH